MACIDRVPSGEPARVSFSSAVHKFNGSRSRISKCTTVGVVVVNNRRVVDGTCRIIRYDALFLL
uniref:Uncharacterized protein n=1 Tax=Oryza sativa subsp. japonica TaxID=39947 RepID=Q6K7I7_ORYSJ|nr:hypothetical protein [Oryza sativa Japonica Group]